MTGPIVIAAGGTGGHLFPARALAGELARAGRATALFTDARGAAWARDFAGAEVHVVRAATPSGRGPFGALRAGGEIAVGAFQARRLLRRVRAPVVVGFGGYPSLPTVLAARGAGARVVLHEQNAVLGRVNRLLQSRATALALSFEATEGVIESGGRRLLVTGNPVREAIAAIRDAGYQPPEPDRTIRLLVFGGSQGARRFGEIVPRAIERLDPAVRGRLEVVQQSRGEDEEAVRADYERLGVPAIVRPFLDDMAMRLAEAHLVIGRAGATTCAELTLAGRPAILIPYPHHGDDQQARNAASLADAGAAVFYREAEFTAEELAARLESLFRRPEVLARMASRSHDAGRAHAAEALARLVLSIAPANGNRTPSDQRRAAA